MAGYHKRKIPRGVLGELSKIEEEFQEYIDAREQGSVIMMLVELADMWGAREAYLEKEGYTLEATKASYHYHFVLLMETYRLGIRMEDLRIFSDITKRAFASGERC